jgi:hypothetical protein
VRRVRRYFRHPSASSGLDRRIPSTPRPPGALPGGADGAMSSTGEYIDSRRRRPLSDRRASTCPPWQERARVSG